METTQPGEPTRLSHSAWPWALGFGAAALWAGRWLQSMVQAGLIDGDPWAHEAGEPFRWVQYIHPPLYSAFMALFEWLYERTQIWPGFLIYAFSGIAVAIACSAAAASVVATQGPNRALWPALAAGWTVVSASNLRPFEHYPPSRLLVALAVWALVAYGRAGRTSMLILAAVLTLTAGELHLNTWVSLGPLWVWMAWRGTARHRLVAGAFAAVMVLFIASMWPGFFEVLEAGPEHPSEWHRPLSVSAFTMEWSNAWLLLPQVLWWTPLARGKDAVGFGVGGAAMVATATTFVLQYLGFCIGGDFFSAHHYFELIDPLLVVGAVLALRAAWTNATERCCTALLVGIVSLVSLHQLELVVRGLDWLSQLARDKGAP